MIKLKLKQLAVSLAIVACSTAANADVVKIWGETLGQLDQTVMNDFYNGLAGHSSTIATGTLDTVNLTGVNLLWATEPANSYTGAEVAAMSSFLANGGRLAFLSDHGLYGYATAESNRINAALSQLGSTISIIADGVSGAGSMTTGDIVSNPLTVGVNSFYNATFAPLSISGTAEALIYGQESSDILMAYQNMGAGSIFVLADHNAWRTSKWEDWDADNGAMFANVLFAETGAIGGSEPPVDPVDPPVGNVPEPISLALLGIGFAGIGVLRRRKAA